MLKLMIVDDEEIIRQSLCDLIDWKSLGIEITALCKNGIEAYDAIMDGSPDIVLTDIQMPGFSGLDLIEWVQRSAPNIKFAILSGYSEFEYARKALHLGVKEYLLKPCNNDKLIEAMHNLVAECLSQNNHSPENVGLIQTILETQIINQVLMECASSSTNFPSMETAYQHVEFHKRAYFLAYCTAVSQDILYDLLKTIYTYRARYHHKTHCFIIQIQQTLILFCKEPLLQPFDLQTLLSESSNPALQHINVNQQHKNCLLDVLEELSPQLMQCPKSLLVQDYRTIPMYNFTQYTQSVLEICQNREQHASTIQCTKLTQILTEIEDLNIAKNIALNILLSLHTENQLELDAATMSDTTAAIQQTTNTLQLVSIIQALFTQSDAPHYKNFIQKVLAYVDAHLSDSELTLKYIADHELFLSANYLSAQFFEQTGVKFSTYLNTQRMNRAKELLLHAQSDKIYLVAEQVGCGNNPQYFSQLFKKYVGITPTAYIKNNLPKDNTQ